ncbi:MAG: hypothetical protein LC808_12295 [Actinobacteria bacterium]|nr:hypothetical protein [Actinomycetota bacterium]
MTAMGFYRDAWKTQKVLTEEKNAPTEADVQATCMILRSAHSILEPLRRSLNCSLSYLSEESDKSDRVKSLLPDDIAGCIHPRKVFFGRHENVIRVILDGIDGTENFGRGLPFFCSALAILVEDQARVSAIYDPIHHLIYSARLPGPHMAPEVNSSASAWEVASGTRLDLGRSALVRSANPLGKEAVGVHISRTNDKARSRLLRSQTADSESLLERLGRESGGIYAFNCGIVAMVHVARGGLGSFINPATYLWDVAAGEVLVRACGGRVTTFSGQAMTYRSPGRVSVISSKEHLHSPILEIVRDSEPSSAEVAPEPVSG